MRTCSEAWPIAVFALAFLPLIPTAWTPNWIKVLLGILSVVAFLFACLLVYARNRQADSVQRHKNYAILRLSVAYRHYVRRLLGSDIHDLMSVVNEVLAEEDPTERRILAANARKAAVIAAANLVGKTAGSGTRANLFRLSPDRMQMALERDTYFGRNERSDRIFSPGNEIFDDTMKNRRRFVRKIPPEVVRAEGLRYNTYLTHPISSGADRVHGVLTVDCPSAGDIDPTIDVPLVAVLSDLIATTYEAERIRPA